MQVEINIIIGVVTHCFFLYAQAKSVTEKLRWRMQLVAKECKRRMRGLESDPDCGV
jgi:hypothetical protein